MANTGPHGSQTDCGDASAACTDYLLKNAIFGCLGHAPLHSLARSRLDCGSGVVPRSYGLGKGPA
eukprot:5507949-Amphidinium_carterae.2